MKSAGADYRIRAIRAVNIFTSLTLPRRNLELHHSDMAWASVKLRGLYPESRRCDQSNCAPRAPLSDARTPLWEIILTVTFWERRLRPINALGSPSLWRPCQASKEVSCTSPFLIA
jgi:hypothetical protein